MAKSEQIPHRFVCFLRMLSWGNGKIVNGSELIRIVMIFMNAVELLKNPFVSSALPQRQPLSTPLLNCLWRFLRDDNILWFHNFLCDMSSINNFVRFGCGGWGRNENEPIGKTLKYQAWRIASTITFYDAVVFYLFIEIESFSPLALIFLSMLTPKQQPLITEASP